MLTVVCQTCAVEIARLVDRRSLESRRQALDLHAGSTCWLVLSAPCSPGSVVSAGSSQSLWEFVGEVWSLPSMGWFAVTSQWHAEITTIWAMNIFSMFCAPGVLLLSPHFSIHVYAPGKASQWLLLCVPYNVQLLNRSLVADKLTCEASECLHYLHRPGTKGTKPCQFYGIVRYPHFRGFI